MVSSEACSWGGRLNYLLDTRAYSGIFLILVVICLIFLPLGNTDAVRNTFGGLAGLMGLIAISRLPKLIRFLLLANLTYWLLSVGWAIDPSASFRDFLAQGLMPACLFAGTFFVTSTAKNYPKSDGRTNPVFWMILAICISATLAACVGLLLEGRISAGALNAYLTRYWPGVGQATTFAALWVTLGLILVFHHPKKKVFYILSALLVVCSVYIGTVQPNRAIWFSFFIIGAYGLIFIIFSHRRSDHLVAMLVLGIALSLVVLSLQKFEERYGPVGDIISSFLATATEDPRVKGYWPYWSQISDERPLFGFGYGQKSVTEARRIAAPTISQFDQYTPFAHPHNFYLNLVIQVGEFGAILFASFVVSVALTPLFLRRHIAEEMGGDRFALTSSALTIVIFMQKNFTDVWTLYGPLIAFYVILGITLGLSLSEDKDLNTGRPCRQG